MGCDWSKNQDAFKDRHRLLNSSGSSIASGGNSQNAMPGNSEELAASSQVYGTSTADCYFKERDDFQVLLEKSQHVFVDISQEPVLMDEADAEERRKQYVEDFGALGPSLDRLVSCPAFVDTHDARLEDTLAELLVKIDRHRKDISPQHDRTRSYISGSGAIATTEDSLVVALKSV